MTRYEEETHVAISRNLPSIASSLNTVAEQLKIANKLKALELKMKYGNLIEMIDTILVSED